MLSTKLTDDGRACLLTYALSVLYTYRAQFTAWSSTVMLQNPICELCRTTCFYSCKAVDKISTDIARRAVRLRQQSSCCESHVRVTAHRIFSILFLMTSRWLASRVVSVLDSGAEGPGFKSQSRRCRVTVLGKLFTPIVPLFTKQRNWQQPS